MKSDKLVTIRYEAGSHAERTEYQKRPWKCAPDLVLPSSIESKKQKGRLSALKEKKGLQVSVSSALGL